ncbi:MAG: NifB/NifX family molybdenum-iron cluster-binding protein [Ectothiorhodospira sp.]
MGLQRRLQLMPPPGHDPEGAGLRLAFASSDLKRVDQHFGDATTLVIHRLGADGQRQQVAVAQFASADRDGGEDKLVPRIRALEGCAAVYCEAAGISAVRQLLDRGVQPVKVPRGSSIRDLLRELRNGIQAGQPPAWMVRAALRRETDPGDFEAMAETPWEME